MFLILLVLHASTAVPQGIVDKQSGIEKLQYDNGIKDPVYKPIDDSLDGDKNTTTSTAKPTTTTKTTPTTTTTKKTTKTTTFP